MILIFALGVVAGLSGSSLLAQDFPAQPNSTATLRVYTNLVQIPVLVLRSRGSRISSPIAQSRFSIRLDNGPWQRPSYARLEAEDPIDLSIVLNAQASPANVVEKLDKTIAGLAPSFLHSQDHVSIYAMDCGRLNYVEDAPAESVQLERAVDGALTTWTARRQKIKAPCNQETHLWDAMAFTADRLSTHSGRRVILAITDGHDGGSRSSLTALALQAQEAGVTLFSWDPAQNVRPGYMPADDLRLSNACELTGGLMLNQPLSDVRDTLRHFTEMLRERYILEFPRPPDLGAGQHVMSVKIDKLDAFIRVSGNSVPLPNRALMADGSKIQPAGPSPPENEAVPAEPVAAAALPAPLTPVALVPVTPTPAAEVQSQATTVAVQQPTPGGTTPTVKVATQLTLEDVTVSDDHHRPVHGLERSDFAVKEDGKPQPIRDFEEYSVSAPAPQSASPQLPPNTYTNAQPTPANTSAINILLLDNMTTGIGGRLNLANIAYPKEQAIDYLKRMPPGTQMAILKLENGLHVVQDVTTDKAVLLSAMNTITFKLLPGSGSPPSSLGEACARANRQSELMLGAMGQEAAYLSSIKGRKNLIWFMPGIPWLTNYPAFSRVPCLVDYTPQLHRAYGLLNAAQVALYPVDPRGVVPDTLGVTAKMGTTGGSPIAIGGSSFGPHASLDSDHSSLQDLAGATGGAAFFNRNDLAGAIDEATTTGADYYSLTYVPPLSRYDGQYHTIEVKVDRPHVSLQYRPGYTSIDLTKQPELANQGSAKSVLPAESAFDTAMGHGAAPSTQLLFDVTLVPSTTTAKPGDPLVIGTLNPMLKGKSLVRYDASFTLTGDQIKLVDGADGRREASINFVILAYDAEGRVLNSFGQSTRWTLKPEQVAEFTQQSLPVKMQVDLPSGKIFVRVGVLDPSSQRAGTLEIPETITK